MNLRTTILRLPQGQLAYVPNAEVFDDVLVNYTQLGSRRVDLECGVSYGDDLEKAKRLAVEAVEGVEARDSSREVELFYTGFGGSSIDFVVRFWIQGTAQRLYVAARSEAIEGLKRAFDENDVSIPFPITTLDFGIVGGRSLAEELQETRTDDGGAARR